MSEKPNFYSVIPATVRYDTNLSSSEKLFYSELTAMSNSQGFCWASNSYFSELYNVSKSTVSLWIKKLESKNHIKVFYQKEGKQIVKREIYPIQKIERGWSENQKGGSQKIERGWSENRKENNTSINNTSINIDTHSGFSFRKSLCGLGVEKKIVDDFLKNRKLKRLANTETAFNRLKKEVLKSKIPLNELFEIIVSKGWGGFQNEWLKNLNRKDTNTKKMSMAQKMRIEYGIN